MKRLYIDFETYCDLNIKKVGLYKYVDHYSFHPWCLAWAIDDEDIQLWKYNHIFDLRLSEALNSTDVKVYAHNAEFERAVLYKIGFGVSLNRFVDTQALAASFGYPLGLDKFCKAIGLPVAKDTNGTRLLNRLCKPQKKTIKNTSGRWYPDTAPKDFKLLYDYCRNDVHIMREAVKRLPKQELSAPEQYVWGHTVVQNERGIQIDIQSVKNIVTALHLFKQDGEKQLRIATRSNVQTAKQVQKIKDFLHSKGVQIPNLTKATVEEYLQRKIPKACREVLELRKQLAHSSVAKFEKMISMSGNDKRIRGNLVYYGGHTGRFAGRGFQVHNLPRAKFNDPEEVLKYINTKLYKDVVKEYPNINETASKLIRPMIIAKKDHQLIVADYSSIENVILHWAAGDKKTTEDFENGLCQYKVYSAKRLGIPYDQVTKEQRNQSKPDVLGLGYGGAENALISVAAGYGVKLNRNAARHRVNFYRNTYKEVIRFWRQVFLKARMAVGFAEPQFLITPNITLEFRYCSGYLLIKLPSGRWLSYPKIKVDAVWEIKVDGRTVPMTSAFSYMGVKNGAWLRIGTHPGKLVENIVQAIARDVLVYGLMCAEQNGYQIIMSVHDEGIAESESGTVEEFCEYMCLKQEWAKTLPLRAEGYISKRYRKE